MRILITGGAGMIGSHVAEHFALKGARVTVLDNLMRSQLFGSSKKSVEYNWNFLGRFKNVRRIIGDVRNQADVRKAVGSGVDAVLHAAGQPGVGYSLQNPLEDFSINAQGTLNLLECVRRHSPKAAVMYCSTNKVYGENVGMLKIREDRTRYRFLGTTGVKESLSLDFTGHTPYGASKCTGDLYVQEYARSYGMKTAVFRMSCIYGTRQFGFEDQGWVAWFAISALLNRPVMIYGDGKQVRDMLYVDDLVRLYEAFIASPRMHGVFNIGGGPKNSSSLLELIARLEVKLGRKMRVRFTDWRPCDQRVYVSDIDKVRRELGWSPRVTVDDGLGRLLTWVEANRKLF